MTVRELVEKLQEIQNKQLKVYVHRNRDSSFELSQYVNLDFIEVYHDHVDLEGECE